jgi:hypothetical protein
MKSRNNLFISLATCYGANFLYIYDLWKECPFYGYVGPISEVDTRDVENSYSAFFEALLDTQNFDFAIQALRQTKETNSSSYLFATCHIFFEHLVRKFGGDRKNSRIQRERE